MIFKTLRNNKDSGRTGRVGKIWGFGWTVDEARTASLRAGSDSGRTADRGLFGVLVRTDRR